MKPELSDYGKKGYDGPMNEKSVNMALSPMGERSMKEQLRNCHSIDDTTPTLSDVLFKQGKLEK